MLMQDFFMGVQDFNLDILARGPLWEAGLDYRCGTGHGVGYLLNVHESPNGFKVETYIGTKRFVCHGAGNGNIR